MIDEIRPCPFCGHKAVVLRLKNDPYDDEQMVCVQCMGTVCGIRTQWWTGDDPGEAIAQWNRRWNE